MDFSLSTIRVQAALGTPSGMESTTTMMQPIVAVVERPSPDLPHYVVHLLSTYMYVPTSRISEGDTDLVSDLFPAAEAVRLVCQVHVNTIHYGIA